MFRTLFGFSNLNKARYYADRAEAMLIGKETAVDKYLDFERAEKYMARHLAGYSRKKVKNEDAEKALERKVLEFKRKKFLEEWRLSDYYGVGDFETLLPDRTRVLKRALWATGLAAAAAIVGATVYGINSFKNELEVRQHYKTGREILIPKINRALNFGNFQDAEEAYRDLVKEKDAVLEEGVRRFSGEIDSIGRNLIYFKNLARARDKFREADGLASRSNYVEALKLLSGFDGAGILLNGIDINGLPDSRKKEFEDLVAKVSVLIDKCSQYKSDFNKLIPIQEDVPKLIEQVSSLESMLNGGDLFDMEKTRNIVNIVDRYLTDLAAVNPNAVGGENVLDNIKSKLLKIKDSIEGKSGLLTHYELVEYNRVKIRLENIGKSLDDLNETQYIEDGVKERISEVSTLINTANEELRKVDSKRVDTLQYTKEISNLENRVTDANKQLEFVVKLKGNLNSDSEDIRITSAIELAKRYFERDFKGKKWDRVKKVLEVIPENKIDGIEEISNVVNSELKLATSEGQITVRDSGLNKGDLADYKIKIDIAVEKRDEKGVRSAVNELLKEADLKEGIDALKILDDLAKVKEEIKILYNNIVSKEEEAKKKETLNALAKSVHDLEGNLPVALAKFGDSARAYLESGEKVPNPSTLETLAYNYNKLGKKERADEYYARAAELKNKYKIE